MDAQRLAGHADREDYLEARDAMLDVDGAQSTARQDQHLQGLGGALGLDLAGDEWIAG